ncbi:metallophosphoesterase family protein [Calycomorphotria hydatis]|uniref:Calcineurin-like phosphoesterase n=1 Tax=Calycomorphotria hydatis TaxID=2528027 RepID=A0A517T5P7_9PLAN|nr:metallophosphoesterase [Calycomorphotria hydatis]QDT63693.1 Calcineurin-like phosphoesterase [Calycomorphotria hydatis]
MLIQSISSEPLAVFPFLNTGKGKIGVYVEHLPILSAEVDVLPDGVDAIVSTSDLQGREYASGDDRQSLRLLGEVLPSWLVKEILPRFGCNASRTGAFLSGDFYTVPLLDQRGGTGDVSKVWAAFADQFKWVVGVAGNHDLFGEHFAPTSPPANNAFYLDGESTVVDGLRVAGIGGIIGNPRKPHRKTDQQVTELIEFLAMDEPDVLLLHDGPNHPESQLKGRPIIRQTLEQYGPSIVIRGHDHWQQPLVTLAGGTQVLNVDSRVVVLTRK